MKKQAAIYARLSISVEESVSIERQLEAGRKYAAARGWEVVGEFVDDGVSATKNRPEQRAGWSALLAAETTYDAVVIWKVDRLARNTLDFLLADRTLQDRGAGIVAVEDPIDMTTPQGRAFATMLAVFAEMEASAISARIRAARSHLVKSGRVPGGMLPYGWISVPNPDGPGRVYAHDPERIDWVRGMVERAQRGEPLYSIAKWLDSSEAPLPYSSARGEGTKWRHGSVGDILRNPILAGQILFNPGGEGKRRGPEVLRDERGLPVVNEAISIMTPGEWRAMVAALDSAAEDRTRARKLGRGSSGLLSGLVYCSDERHDPKDLPKMWRGTSNGQPAYYCPECHMTMAAWEDIFVEDYFLPAKGDWPRWSKVVEVRVGGAEELPEVEFRLAELDDLIRDASSREERDRLRSQQDDLYELRDNLREQPGTVEDRWVEGDDYFSELWARAETVEDRRAVLEDAVERIIVRRGRPGRRTKQQVMDRLHVEWKRPEETGPRPLEP